ncbi:MAG: endonuclease domain-containing protein [Sphingomonas taxi]|uniref:Endonuclease domain-containing protein n=1 Tax=Sphingomonas taxi TaxID=1549858 RepID=A0A2W4YYZ8_9SPHN|nr:MAG: endonuclease domain-containing protein [Sphingomonas taxi]
MDKGGPLLPPLPQAGGDRGVGPRHRLDRPTERARDLSNDTTNAEQMLWGQLKGSRLQDLKFSRQMPIAGYFADFVCRSHKLIVELDGSQHVGASAYDASRTQALEAAGYRVIRFWNNDLTSNMPGVLETILAAAIGTERAPTPQPPPASGRGSR